MKWKPLREYEAGVWILRPPEEMQPSLHNGLGEKSPQGAQHLYDRSDRL